MAKQVKTSLDFNKNEIQNVVVQKLAAAPGSPVSGQIYFNTTEKAFYYYDGTAWVKLTATPSVTNLGTGVEVYRDTYENSLRFRTVRSANSFLVISPNGNEEIEFNISPGQLAHSLLGGIGTNTHAQIDTHITSTANPHAVSKAQVGLGNVTNDAQLKAADLDTDGALAANSDAKVPSQKAVKSYVDNKVTGVSWKDSVRVATTANITLTGTQSIDGVAVVAGDRVLVKNQTTASQNGIYVVAAGAWSRAVDNDSAAEMLNATVMVQDGATNADTQWTCSTNAPITLNTTALAFSQMSGAGTYGAGTGLQLTGNTFGIDATVVQKDAVQTLTNKTINADNNTLSNLQTSHFKAGVIDNDATLNNNSGTKLPTQYAVKQYVDNTKLMYYKAVLTAVTTLSVPAATHGCGLAPVVQVYETSGGNSSLVEVDIVVSAAGAVSFTSSSAITGYMVIIGK